MGPIYMQQKTVIAMQFVRELTCLFIYIPVCVFLKCIHFLIYNACSLNHYSYCTMYGQMFTTGAPYIEHGEYRMVTSVHALYVNY